jgi:TRAP-type C4-dicarboxylate transport system permease small subunit
MAIIFFVLLGQIVLRPLGISFNWTQEFTMTVFVWLVFFGIAAAYCRNEHMAVDFLYNILEPRLGKTTRTVWRFGIEVLQMAVVLVLAVSLVKVATESWSLRAGSIPEFRIGYLYLGAFLAVGISIVAQVSNAIKYFSENR